MVRLSLHSSKGRTLKPSSATIDVLWQEILLLHELETLAEFVPPEASGAALNVIMPKVCELHFLTCRIFGLCQVKVLSTLANLCSGKAECCSVVLESSCEATLTRLGQEFYLRLKQVLLL